MRFVKLGPFSEWARLVQTRAPGPNFDAIIRRSNYGTTLYLLIFDRFLANVLQALEKRPKP
jgi:hypothetical protein